MDVDIYGRRCATVGVLVAWLSLGVHGSLHELLRAFTCRLRLNSSRGKWGSHEPLPPPPSHHAYTACMQL